MVSTRKRIYAEVDVPVSRPVFKAKRKGKRSIGTQTSSRGYSYAPVLSRQTALVKRWDNSPNFPTLVGKGDYKSFFRNVGRGIQTVGRAVVPAGTFSKLGSALGGGAGTVGGAALGGLAGPLGGTLGGYAGGIAGGLAGQRAGDSFAQMVGFGDYQVKANSLMDLPMGKQVAQFGNMSNATIIRHREFVQHVITPASPTVFSVQRLSLNPGLRSVFPWLSTIAGNYQEYQFLGCVIEFRSLSSDSAAALPLGSVTIAANYDTADFNYASKRDMLNSQYCVSSKPSEFMIHPIECDPKVTFVPIKYTRSGAGAAGTDSRLYDHCNVQIATEGLPSTVGQILGEIWISYEIALYKPQLGVNGCLMDHFYLSTGTEGPFRTATPLGAAANLAQPRGGTQNGLGITFTSTQIVLPQTIDVGRYAIWLLWRNSAAGAMTGGPIVLASSSATVVPVSILRAGLNSIMEQNASAADNVGSYTMESMYTFDVTNPQSTAATLTVSGFTCAATDVSLEIMVWSLPPGQL